MCYFISSSDRCVRSPGRTAIRALLIGGVVLLTACTTPFRSPGESGPPLATQLERNVFAVHLPKPGRVSNPKTAELRLLRCADVTLAYGFQYFVVMQDAHQPAATMLEGHAIETVRPESMGLSFTGSEAGLSPAATLIACFRKQPPGFPEAHNAEAVFDRLSRRYGVQGRPEARANPLDASPLQFKLNSGFLLLSRTEPEQIVFLEPNSAQRTIAIGVLKDWENPCATMEEFKNKAALAAAILGGQAVQIQSDNGATRPGSSDSFSAMLLLVPRACLGLENEVGQWPRTELVVRGFDKESLAPDAGLRIGDRIIELNGVDVLQEKRFVEAWLSWSVGQSVVVTFVRDGTEMSLQATTIPNQTRIQ